MQPTINIHVKRSPITYTLQLALGYPAHTVGVEVGVSGLDASKTTQILIARLKDMHTHTTR